MRCSDHLQIKSRNLKATLYSKEPLYFASEDLPLTWRSLRSVLGDSTSQTQSGAIRSAPVRGKAGRRSRRQPAHGRSSCSFRWASPSWLPAEAGRPALLFYQGGDGSVGLVVGKFGTATASYEELFA